MRYTVNRTNPSNVAINVDMSSTKKQLGLTWVGQYYSRYGEVQSENFLRLLENFANDVQPNDQDDSGLALNNVLGQLWYHTLDTENNVGKTLKVFNDNRFTGTDGWKRLEPIINNNEPTEHSEGELWFQPSSNTLKISRGNRWEELTVFLAKDSEKLDGLVSDQFVRSDIDDTVFGTLRTSAILPDRHRVFDLGKPANRWKTIYAETLDVENSHSLFPEFTDTYDIGNNASRWRNGFFTLIDSINFKNVSPLSNNSFSLGNSSKKWNEAHISTLFVGDMSTFVPINAGQTIGTSTERWSTAYIDNLDVNSAKHLIPENNNQYDLGSSSKKWRNIFVH